MPFNFRCYIVGEEEPFAAMTTPRKGAASTVVLNATSLWITGGMSNDNLGLGNALSTTEMISISDNADPRPGPGLPFKSKYHCLANSSPNKVILIALP